MKTCYKMGMKRKCNVNVNEISIYFIMIIFPYTKAATFQKNFKNFMLSKYWYSFKFYWFELSILLLIENHFYIYHYIL